MYMYIRIYMYITDIYAHVYYMNKFICMMMIAFIITLGEIM